SNIIFCDAENKIVDSIKHISTLVSSVREVLPGREYFIPNTQEKRNPYEITEEEFLHFVLEKPLPLDKALYQSLTGFSSVMANELLYRSSLSERNSTKELSEMEKLHLYRNFCELMNDIQNKIFCPTIVFQGDTPIEFAGTELTGYQNNKKYRTETRKSISLLLYE
ncbi:MAG TPA: RNA-binding protein, partial [Lachnospiraceae bacterium]|nr:RNA-binding protein [Lachnospiraceae bacterium]